MDIPMTARAIILINLHSGHQVGIGRSDRVSHPRSVSTYRSIKRGHGDRPFKRILSTVCPRINKTEPEPKKPCEKYDHDCCNQSRQEPEHFPPYLPLKS
jgi:hypothetical protein